MPTSQPIPTLDDVARSAGVSTATVSRCLNTPGQVAKPTMERVMKAVEVLGYTPNFGARSMASKRTHTIGAIIPTMENAIFARGLQAFQEELHKLGYTLLVSSTGYRPEVEEEQVRALVSRGADALLLIGFDRSPETYAYLGKRNVPALVSWAYAPDHSLPSIGFDNRTSMQELAQHVISLGHRDIAVITAVLRGNDRAALRLAGIRDAMEQSGHAFGDLRVIETPYGISHGERALDQLMDGGNRPTVIMCGNDVLAAGALKRAKERGLGVPKDLSITGFDDIELARIVTPALTTVHVPHREMGRKAAQELVSILEKRGAGHSVALETKLMIRDSLSLPSR
ncbi:putative transcriptional regulator, lacI family [Sulfitobacter noctilucicola]|uniref:LacI family transcriptional regulator n=1 Tax=Sulfitobacter noctilucicola TaxID=1342301 RepID=A0A7W6Q2Q4_9RHOB|nr:LacI family DNA-binding transcriptional regulator [Sulfitobacter noctilucicola]KIN62167.1 putative transcriptional regulator, lacI family [Sulfitobacter noctilucicola]MBB4173315.1 LacI family transcriptional regulator [Sulfitobacter noctilucicola]